MPATCQDHCQAIIQRQDDEESEEDEIGLLVRLWMRKHNGSV